VSSLNLKDEHREIFLAIFIRHLLMMMRLNPELHCQAAAAAVQNGGKHVIRKRARSDGRNIKTNE
jgi:hypothetical protein